jgi:mannose-1-phosphate guanylyltransferase
MTRGGILPPMPLALVIMAGGRGTRFWPLSTATRPKQFLDLERTGRTLLQATFDRLQPLLGAADHLFVATAAPFVPLVREQLPHLPPERILIEPASRDSGPAIALAALTIERSVGPSLLAFFSSDHKIADVAAFHHAVRVGAALSERERALLTLGVVPTYPSTAFGYVRRGAAVGEGYRVAAFVEKPNAVRAAAYLERGDHYWNAGIFIAPSDVLLDEYAEHAPELLAPLRAASTPEALAEAFVALPRRSIDYAVMEQTRRALVIPLDCGWDDIGDWVALERLLGRDADANTVAGRHVGLEASGNIVYTEADDDVVVTVGVHDLIVVKRGNTVLLVAKDRVGELRRLQDDERLSGVVP